MVWFVRGFIYLITKIIGLHTRRTFFIGERSPLKSYDDRIFRKLLQLFTTKISIKTKCSRYFGNLESDLFR